MCVRYEHLYYGDSAENFKIHKISLRVKKCMR